MKTSFDDMGENIATHRTLWHNVVKEPSKTASSGTELAPAMIPAIAPLRAIVDAIKPFKSGWMFPSRCGGVLDLDNLAARVTKPLLEKTGLLWHGWQAYQSWIGLTPGIFWLLAVRNPPANRSVIVFAAWSSFAHASVMAVMAVHLASERGDLLIAGAAFSIIGAALIVLAPAKQPGERASASGA